MRGRHLQPFRYPVLHARLALLIGLTAQITACGSGSSDITGSSGGTATLVVQVGGLPKGVNAAIQIAQPGGETRTVTATTTLESVPAGSYQFTLGPIRQGNTTWYPDVTSDSLTVAKAAVNTFHGRHRGAVRPAHGSFGARVRPGADLRPGRELDQLADDLCEAPKAPEPECLGRVIAESTPQP